MSFEEQRFNTDISYRSQGGPGWLVDVVSLDSGSESRIARWELPRHRYSVGFGIRRYEELEEIRRFYIAMGGAAIGFRYYDWLDCATNSDGRSPSDSTVGGWEGDPVTNVDQLLGTGDASEDEFQLRKEYTIGGRTVWRPLTKIVSGSVKVAFDGVDQPSGWTVNNNTGIITFSSPPGSGVDVTAGCEFDVPVRFDESTSDWLSVSAETYSSGNVAVGLIEIKDPITLPTDSNPGGSEVVDISSGDYQLAIANARFIICNGDTTYNLRLPATSGLPLGGPYFYIYNSSASNDLIIKDSTDTTTVATIPVLEMRTFLLGAAAWYVF